MTETETETDTETETESTYVGGLAPLVDRRSDEVTLGEILSLRVRELGVQLAEVGVVYVDRHQLLV